MRSNREALTRTALLLAVSFVLSWLESFIPLRAFFPIPGLKLGLANAAVMTAMLTVGKRSALSIAVLRPILNLLLFGNATSFFLSLCGGLLSFAVLCALLPLYRRYVTLGGISVLCAVFHGIGQCAAAGVLMRSGGIWLYAPLLCAASCVTGLFTGWLTETVISHIIPKREEI